MFYFSIDLTIVCETVPYLFVRGRLFNLREHKRGMSQMQITTQLTERVTRHQVKVP